jgi:tRNA threonylcarbamoyladenosine modification (KEOPS) complex  Pcc1 subunit
MNYKAEIFINDLNILKIFEAEEQVRNDRATWELKAKKGGALFFVKAKDSVALRAVLNTITKSLTVYERLKNDIEQSIGKQN